MARVCVIGSSNLDFTVSVPRLPGVGETVSGGTLMTSPGGKGANQAVAARRLGADVAFVEAPQTMEEVISIPRLVRGPCLFNLAPGTKSPVIDLRETAKLGYAICIVPGILSKATVEACDDALEVLRTTHLPPTPRTSVAEGFRRFGADEWNALRRKFAPQPADGAKSDKSER